tara:strand:+ start:1969 stop:2133 length:165 start_codon:yes stop_codon:yes gene_type:complete
MKINYLSLEESFKIVNQSDLNKPVWELTIRERMALGRVEDMLANLGEEMWGIGI